MEIKCINITKMIKYNLDYNSFVYIFYNYKYI